MLKKKLIMHLYKSTLKSKKVTFTPTFFMFEDEQIFSMTIFIAKARKGGKHFRKNVTVKHLIN